MSLSLESLQNKFEKEIARSPKSLIEFENFLVRWWCRHYNKPYKSKEWEEYTFEELFFEFLEINYRENPKLFDDIKEKKKEEETEKEDMDWMDAEAAKFGLKFFDKNTQEKISSEVSKKLNTVEDGVSDEPISVTSVGFVDETGKEVDDEEEFDIQFFGDE